VSLLRKAIPGKVAGLDYDVLEALLGYALRRAQVAMFLSFHKATRGLEMTPPRFTALVLIGANPDMSQSTLGEALGIARSGAKMLTDWMEARGLVERRQHADGRVWGLHLTPRGEALTAATKKRVLAQDRRRSSALDARERAQLTRLLNKLSG